MCGYGWAMIMEWTAGTPLGEESIGHFLSGAGNVTTRWSCAFDKSE